MELTAIDWYILDFLWNIESSRIRTLDGTFLVCAYWNLFGIHRIQRWFQSEICRSIHGPTLFEVIPLAGWRTSWLRTCICLSAYQFSSLLIFFFSNWFSMSTDGKESGDWCAFSLTSVFVANGAGLIRLLHDLTCLWIDNGKRCHRSASIRFRIRDSNHDDC